MNLNSNGSTVVVLRALMFVAVVLVALVTVKAQTSSTFHTRLGEPVEATKTDGQVVKERFEIDGGLSVIINYRKSGSPEILRIVPRWSKLSNIDSDPTVPQDTFRAVLHLLIQKGERGKYIIGTFLNFICVPKDNDCGAGVREDFENLSIYYNSGNTGMRYVDVTWKDK